MTKKESEENKMNKCMICGMPTPMNKPLCYVCGSVYGS